MKSIWAAVVVVLVVLGACSVAKENAVTPAESTSPSAPANATATTTAATTPKLAPDPTVAATATPSPEPSATAAPAPPPTVVRTVRPTSAAQPPAGTRAYTTLPPGTTLPTDQQCASEAGSDPWDPRPENRVANQSNAWAKGFRLQASYLPNMAPGYEERVTGNFTGTTDQILRWGACKWGFDEDDVRAQAVVESTWRQSTLGDCGGRTQAETKGCASVGLMQVKGADIPATHPGTWPAAMTSSAFNIDYALAVRRLCYEGKETWLRQTNASVMYAPGDLWGCIGRWYSGKWRDQAALTYIQKVQATLSARTWRSTSF